MACTTRHPIHGVDNHHGPSSPTPQAERAEEATPAAASPRGGRAQNGRPASPAPGASKREAPSAPASSPSAEKGRGGSGKNASGGGEHAGRGELWEQRRNSGGRGEEASHGADEGGVNVPEQTATASLVAARADGHEGRDGVSEKAPGRGGYLWVRLLLERDAQSSPALG